MLKPMDIHNKEFKKSVRGYDAEEVDEFLDEIIVDFEKMQRELDLLRNQLNSYNENMNSYKERETALNNALVSAQQFADHLKKEAEQKATLMIQEAEQKASEIINSTEAQYNQMVSGYKTLASRYDDAKAALKEYFENQIKMLDQDEPCFDNPNDMIAYIENDEVKKEAKDKINENEKSLSSEIHVPHNDAVIIPPNISSSYFERSHSTTREGNFSASENDNTKINMKLKEMINSRG